MFVPVYLFTAARRPKRSQWARWADGSAHQAHGACPRTPGLSPGAPGARLCQVCALRRVTASRGRACPAVLVSLRLRGQWHATPSRPVGTWCLSSW